MAGRLNFMPSLSSLNFERADNGDAAFMALSVSFRETFKINAQLVSEFFLVENLNFVLVLNWNFFLGVNMLTAMSPEVRCSTSGKPV